MADECCASNGNIMILACSGGSNVGQLANQAAVELTQEGFGKMYCLAGIGGRLSGFAQSAQDAATVVVIDGCEVGCGRAIFKENGLALKRHLVITDLGIKKDKNLTPGQAEVDAVKAAVRQAAARV